ncbi:MAG: c-type cytochrome [Planctomycetota bacterium]|jgi:mono/diheme cytochrome c family protein
MPRSSTLVLLTALFACASPSAYRPDSAYAASVAEAELQILLQGSVLYHRSSCRSCHGYGAKGGSRAPSLIDDTWLHCDGSEAGIRSIMVDGVSRDQLHDPLRPEPMPTAASLEFTSDEVDATAAYVYAIGNLPRKEAHAESRVDALMRGSVLYHQSTCRKCHYSGAASGGSARGPSLVDSEWLHCDGSVAGMARVIEEGIPFAQVQNKAMARESSMPPAAEMDVTDEQVEILAQYLYAIGKLKN